MKHKPRFSSLLAMACFLALAPAALASNTWYVDGVNGGDSNDCMSPQTACKTIGQAISLAKRGDSIMVAAAIYTENLIISSSLKIIGSNAATTIVDGGQVTTVVTILNKGSHVSLSKLTIRNGAAQIGQAGGGINNNGTLSISHSTISGNSSKGKYSALAYGGGIFNLGTLLISHSTISGNSSNGTASNSYGGGIYNAGTTTINNSTISKNISYAYDDFSRGGGVYNSGTVAINNSTISGNSSQGQLGGGGGGIYNVGTVTINNGTISWNGDWWSGGNIYAYGPTTLQNSIVAKATWGGNCDYSMTSLGYNLSDDNSCTFDGPGDMNNTNPKLGKLGNYGGPTQTIPLWSVSPAIDAGNPNGCTDGNGNLLKTDQRGYPRPGREDTGGCDIGAFERQID